MSRVKLIEFRTISVVLFLALAACGGSDQVEEKTVETSPNQMSVKSGLEPSNPTGFVLVPSTAKLFLSPDLSSEFVQFRTDSEFTSWERERQAAERSLKIAEKDSDDARREREKKAQLKARKRAKKKKKKKRKRLSKKQRKRLAEKNRLAKERKVSKAEQVRRSRAQKRVKKRIEMQLRDMPDGHHRRFFAFQRIRSNVPGWIQLESLSGSEDPSHCFQTGLQLPPGVALRFWVKDSDLADVITREVVVKFEHEAEIRLLPGVGVSQVSGDEYDIFVNGYKFRGEIEPGAVGSTYEPIRPFAAEMTDTVFHPVGFAEQKLRLNKQQRLQPNPTTRVFVNGTLTVGRRFYAMTETACAQIRVRTSKEWIEPVGRRSAERLSGVTFGTNPPAVRSNATLYRPDGTPVGRAQEPFSITPEPKDRLTCFRLPVWKKSRDGSGRRTTMLCVEPSAVQN